MRNRLDSVGLLTLLLASPWLTASAAEPSSVEAVGVRVVSTARPEDGDQMRAFSWSAGTTLALVVRKPAGGIIGFVKKNSTLAECKDDKGVDLLKAPSLDKFVTGGLSDFPRISPDGKAILIEASVPALPAKGATQLHLAGELAIQVATQKKDFQADINIKPDEKINAGAIPLAIGKTGAPEWGGENYKFSITLKASQDLSSIAAIKFLDAQGKEIESKFGGKTSFGFGDRVSVEQELLFKAPFDKARIVISYWTDMQTEKMPLNLKVGIGL